MDDAEDGRVRRNPERQGENGGRGKSRASPQRPCRVPQIASQDLDRGERLKRSTIFLQQGGVAELPSRGQCGLFPGHPLRHESVREQPHVFLDLVIETIVTLLSAQKSTQLRRECAEPDRSTCVHGYPSASCRSSGESRRICASTSSYGGHPSDDVDHFSNHQNTSCMNAWHW
jgi:hypothetical protein